MQHGVTTAMLGAFRSFQILYREELMYSEVKDGNREEILTKLREHWDQENGDERVLSFFSRFGVHKFGVSTNWSIHSCSQSLVGVPYISGTIVPGSRESYWTRVSKINLSPSLLSSLPIFHFIVVLFYDRVSLYIPGYSQTGHSPASDTQAHPTGLFFSLKKK